MADAMQEGNRRRLHDLEQEVEQLRRAADEAIRRAASQCTPKEAADRLREAQEEICDVDAMPHTFFAPGQLKVLKESLNRALDWLNAGATDAASSTAQVIIAQARLLAERILAAMEEWVTLFNAYAGRVDSLRQQLDGCMRDPVRTPSGEFLRDRDCLRYFSSGLYIEEADALAEIDRTILSPVRQDAMGAFAQGGLPSVNGLTSALTDVEKHVPACEAAIRAADQEMYYSDERLEAGRGIARLLAAEGYEVVFAGFEDEDALKAYVVCGQLGSDTVVFHIRPVRRDGIVENNEMEIRCEAAVQQAAQLTRLWKQRAAGVCGKMVIYDKEAARAKVRNPAQEPDPRRYAEAKRGLQVYD